HQIGIFRLKFLEKYKVIRIKRTRKNDLFGSYLLGLTFSFGWTPCVGPVLGAVIVVSAGGGQAIYGALLMAIYALGLMIPFLAMALLSNVLISKFEKMEKHLGTIKKVGGLLIVIMGLLLMSENLNILTGFFENLIS
ncbi:MAG: cytochrome c biogenesis CcdA family protein, partial [Acidaminobacteraceae bacterium]